MQKRRLFGSFLLIFIGAIYIVNIAIPHDSTQNTPSSFPAPTPEISEISLLFAGDGMFDRHIREKAEQHGYDVLLEDLQPFLSKFSAVVMNLEGPITSEESVSKNSMIGEAKNFIFTFDPSVSLFLLRNNITIVNLGNNHIHHFGTDGITETKSTLEQSGIQFFGDTNEQENKQRTTMYTKGIMKVGFVNYNEFTQEGKARSFADIKKLKPEVDFLVMYTHWGTEYVQNANKEIQTLAHQFIEAGADLIIGSHPHVVQQKEEYNGKTIYYSLGNFVFDQYFSQETTNGLLVQVLLKKNSEEESFTVEIQEHPIRLLENGKTVLGKQ